MKASSRKSVKKITDIMLLIWCWFLANKTMNYANLKIQNSSESEIIEV